MNRLAFAALLALIAPSLSTLEWKGASAQGADPLFGEAPSAQAADALAAADSGISPLRSRAMVTSFPRLTAATAAGQAGDRGPLLTLNLFDDVVLPTEFERFETDAFGHQTWVGRVQGAPTSTVTLTWKGDVLSGGVQVGDDVYRLTTRAGVAIVDQLDPQGFGPELPPVVPPDGPAMAPGAASIAAPAGNEIADIFVYYTAAARAGQGGPAQIQALIAQGIADSNTAYGRSGVVATLRLAGMAELTGFVETASMSADLSTFRGLATVADTRNATGADLMHLVLADPTASACGVAYLGPNINFAHGVSARQCFGQYTFTHEVGHNFGNNHAPGDDSPNNPNPYRPYSFGYKNCAAAPPFRTIMAYACPGGTGTRILNLSNPGIPFNGLTTGTTTQNNALSQAESFGVVQTFRGSPATLPTAPQNLQASVVGNQITVTWQPPATGAPITTYIVRAGTGPGLSNVFNGAVGTLTSVSSPIPNGTYYIRVLAQNAAGLGLPTADVVAQVGLAPGPPQNATASVSGPNLTLTWSPPASGGAVSTYIVQIGSGSGLANFFSGAVGLTTAVGGPVPPGTYYLRVYAQGPGGTSAASNEAVATVGPSCTIPSAPLLSGSKAGNVITLNWTTPAGGPVSAYTVRAGSGSGLANLFNGSVGFTNTVSAAVGNGNYYIRVSANAACGEGAESNELLITIP